MSRGFAAGICLAALVVAGCGGGGASSASGGAAMAGSPAAKAADRAALPLRLHARLLGHLPAPVQLPAVAALGSDGALVMGGLDRADASVDAIVRIAGSHAAVAGRLPAALHDAAGVPASNTSVLFIGGGNAGADSSGVFRVSSSGSATRLGALPQPASDVSAARIGRSVYAVGGFTGIQPLDTIVRIDPGGTAHVVAHMPHPLRYAAVAAAAGRVVIAGGTIGTTASDAVLAFNPARNSLLPLGRLPTPLTHAAAISLDGRVYILGGRGAALNSQRRTIYAIDPVSGRVRRAGRLPMALSDIGAASLGNHALAVGGRDASGGVHDEIWSLAP